jgi:hypothetical protein
MTNLDLMLTARHARHYRRSAWTRPRPVVTTTRHEASK